MSFHSKQPIPPLRHRSSSAVRSSTNTYSNRPRSVGYINTSSYSSPYSSSPYSSAYSTYSSNYKSPYFPNGYRGSTGSSGYASLTIPAKSLANVKNIIMPNYSKTYDNNSRDYLKSDSGHRSRRDLGRTGSFNRDRSLSRSRSSLASSGMGSKSVSLTSLTSEGYISGNDRSSRSRLGSTADIRNENGEIDYKKLYEQAIAENGELKDKLKKTDQELRDTKQTLEKLKVVTSKNSLSELEKRERRAMERKLSEMEEELKQLDLMKIENQKLKDENGALIRVISKLSK